MQIIEILQCGKQFISLVFSCKYKARFTYSALANSNRIRSRTLRSSGHPLFLQKLAQMTTWRGCLRAPDESILPPASQQYWGIFNLLHAVGRYANSTPKRAVSLGKEQYFLYDVPSSCYFTYRSGSALTAATSIPAWMTTLPPWYGTEILVLHFIRYLGKALALVLLKG